MPVNLDEPKLWILKKSLDEMAQVSTAISDFVLAASSFYSAYYTKGHPYQSFYGLMVIGIAATIGSARFLQRQPSTDLVSAHQVFAWLAKIIAMPFLAAGVLEYNLHKALSSVFTYIPLPFLLVYKFMPSEVKGFGNVFLPVASTLSILTSCCMVMNLYGIYSVVTIVAAGAVGDEGDMLGVLKVDIFHYLLAFGYALYRYSLE